MTRTSLASSVLSAIFLSALVEAGVRLPAAAISAVVLALASHAAWWAVVHELGVRHLRGRTDVRDRFRPIGES
jgi:hypothetical protein